MQQIASHRRHRHAVCRPARRSFFEARISMSSGRKSSRPNAWLLALSAAITVLTMVLRALRWQYLLAPIGHARFGAGVSHDHDRLCGERRAAGAGRRGHSPVSARAAGRSERDGDLRDDHHRASARCRDVRHAAGVVRPVLRSGNGQRRQPVVLAGRDRRRRSSARWRSWCWARCS